MTFWTVMLGTICGVFVWDIVVSFIKVTICYLEERAECKSRKIGFGDEGGKEKKAKGPTMRKIGFGENE